MISGSPVKCERGKLIIYTGLTWERIFVYFLSVGIFWSFYSTGENDCFQNILLYFLMRTVKRRVSSEVKGPDFVSCVQFLIIM